MREDGGADPEKKKSAQIKPWRNVGEDLQALHDSEGADPKVFSEDGKEAVKECRRPTYAFSKSPIHTFKESGTYRFRTG